MANSNSEISLRGFVQTKHLYAGTGRSPFPMTNRGLAVKLQITRWLADTHLAYLECSQPNPIPNQCPDVNFSIFLRRLTEDDQNARVNHDGYDLILDTQENSQSD